MAIHVQDEHTDWLVREFARRRGVGITAAIRIAVEEAMQGDEQEADALARRLEPLREQIRALKKPGFSEGGEKEFMDRMWGEGE